MAPVVTEAIVLHAFDYLETSQILRLLTRESGVQSVLARGARRSRKRFGSAMDLFAQGMAEIHTRPNRELQTLGALDVTRARSEIGNDVGRFTAASMISEIVLRFPYEEAAGILDTVEESLDRIAAAEPEDTLQSALGGAWRIISELGFTPALDVCANCHAPLDPSASVAFSHSAGGALCARCGAAAPGTRTIPASARDALRTWIAGGDTIIAAIADARAHQRLLREFFQQHLGTDRELRAFRVWEQGAWSAA
jgi:DNA repair protein RecO (recombination protein O)